MSLDRSYSNINILAGDLSNNVDGLIEDLFQEAYTLPVYETKFTDCKTGLFPHLQHILFNNRKIAGLIVSNNKQQLVCSTLPNNEAVFSASVKPRSIMGPFRMDAFDQPVYLVQQKMGNYHVGILITAPILQSVLQTRGLLSNSIALHDNILKQNLIKIEYSEEQKRWIFNKEEEKQPLEKSDLVYAADELQSIDGVVVVVFANPKTLLKNLWYSQVILAISLLLLSYILYSLMNNFLSNRYSLRGALRIALKNDAFYPLYQPLYDTKQERYTGVEVLLRWRDHNDETIMPDSFIKEAEVSGLIVPITISIINKSLRESAEFLHNNDYFHLSFNISALHFIDQTFFTALMQLLDKYQVLSKQIILEVTERDLIDQYDQIFIDKMNELRKSGFSLAVDDYGTGHASITYLQSFPFNYLKIDKIFVNAIGTKAINESLIDAIIRMAKDLNLIIIAEGVENQMQAQYLIANDVELLQGWFYAKALNFTQLHKLLTGEHNE